MDHTQTFHDRIFRSRCETVDPSVTCSNLGLIRNYSGRLFQYPTIAHSQRRIMQGGVTHIDQIVPSSETRNFVQSATQTNHILWESGSQTCGQRFFQLFFFLFFIIW